MKCLDPRHKRKVANRDAGYYSFPCGQCMPCRINKQMEWRNRMMMESFTHTTSTFITLTYGPEFVPPGGRLNKRDVDLFLKRYRKRLAGEGRHLRYFLVGEYGRQTYRPHYHMIHFGGSLNDEKTLHDSWSQGFTSVAEFNHKRANYITGYCLKKWTTEDRIPDHLSLAPEFAFMSKRPGLGTEFAKVVAAGYAKVAAKLGHTGSVPEPGSIAHITRQLLGPEMYTFRTDGKKYGMSKFVRDKIKYEMEWDGLSEMDKELMYEMLKRPHSEEKQNGKVEKAQAALRRSSRQPV